MSEYEAAFAEVPGHTDALLAAWDSTGEFDEARYEQAVITLSAQGQVGFVLIAWARTIACAYASSNDPFDLFEGRIEAPVLEQGRRLVDVARSGDLNRMASRMMEMLDALDDEQIQRLIFAQLWLMRHLLTLAGGREHRDAILELVAPCAKRCEAVVTAEPLAYALAVLSRGHQEPAREALGALLGVISPQHVLMTLMSLASEVMTNPSKLVTLDEHGVPSAVDVPGDPQAGSEAQLLSRGVEVIRALQDRDSTRAGQASSAIAAHSLEERFQLIWYLAVSLGYRLNPAR